MPLPAVAGANAARHHHGDEGEVEHALHKMSSWRPSPNGAENPKAVDVMRAPRRHSRHNDEDQLSNAQESPPESYTPHVSWMWLQNVLNAIYDKRRIKRSPITPWMVEGSFHPQHLVGSLPPTKDRIKEGIMHKLGVRNL